MTTRRRVLWLTKGLGRGGTERLLVGGARAIDRSRFDVEVAYILPWKDAFVADLERQGVVVHCLGRRRPLTLTWVSALRRLVRDGAFDIVHTHMPYPAVVARVALSSRTPRLVHTEHNMWDRYRRLTAWTNAWTYHRNAAVLAVSDGVARSIERPRILAGRPMPPVRTLIHGIDPDMIRSGPDARAAARATLGLSPDQPVVGAVGNFTAKKDQRTLLRAIGLLARDHPEIQLVLIGSGPLEGELRAQARDRRLRGHVLFAGSRDDVLELLPALDVFALSSRYEGLSIALIEAMATGLPCVATAVGGIPEVLEDGRQGVLVPPGDAEALAEAIGTLLEDPVLRAELGQRGEARARRFDLSQAMGRLQHLYDEVLDDATASSPSVAP